LRCVLDEVEGSAAHLLTTALPPRQQRYLVTKRDRYEEGVRHLLLQAYVPENSHPANRRSLSAPSSA